MPNELSAKENNDMLDVIGFDSVSTYVWIHNHEPASFPFTDYKEFAKICESDYKTFSEHYKVPYFPNVTVGWDSSPRTIPSDKYDYLSYPFVPILKNNTPENFKEALQAAKDFLEERAEDVQILTINAWNEWTEGSYLEPDEEYGYGHLDAIKAVFSKK